MKMLLPIALLLSTPAAAATGDPIDRMSKYDNGVVAIMREKLPLAMRIPLFEALVRNYYDMPAIAALVVGSGWTGTSALDRASAISSLTHHSAVTLARNFASYDGERFTVDPSATARGARQVVKVTIGSAGGGNVLLYALQKGAGGWRIVDVISDGVSQLAVQRADLASTVASGGAAGLARRLAQVDGKAK